jgi:hypothetical protein
MGVVKLWLFIDVFKVPFKCPPTNFFKWFGEGVGFLLYEKMRDVVCIVYITTVCKPKTKFYLLLSIY